MERQIPGSRQRRLGGINPACGALATALQRGYAAASTNAGHTGEDASFALGHPEKLADFGYRAVHETALRGQATVAAFYGSPARLSYFNGCSGGGRMAFQEAQRFPADFDAILAGAPGFDRVNQSVQMLMNAVATLDRPDSMIPSGKYAVIHRAALAACDAADGLKDGLISDPLHCHFDPKTIECKGGDAGDCLTSAQTAAATRIYAGVRNPTTGVEIFPGLEPGSELTWGRSCRRSGPRSRWPAISSSTWSSRIRAGISDPSISRETTKPSTGSTASTSVPLRPISSRSPAGEANCSFITGGRIKNVAPRSSVNYHARLVQTMGAKQVDEMVRLFFAPGMAHCGGGEGPNNFDALTPLEEWREQGKAPTHIVASHLAGNGQVDRTRPLCPYPQVATYKGAGSIDQAENFVCASAPR